MEYIVFNTTYVQKRYRRSADPEGYCFFDSLAKLSCELPETRTQYVTLAFALDHLQKHKIPHAI